jgi:hypothetical protein
MGVVPGEGGRPQTVTLWFLSSRSFCVDAFKTRWLQNSEFNKLFGGFMKYIICIYFVLMDNNPFIIICYVLNEIIIINSSSSAFTKRHRGAGRLNLSLL